MKIGLISDTHLRDGQTMKKRLEPIFAGVQMILHAGDIVSSGVLRDLGELAQVLAVHGNMDPVELKLQLPAKRVVELGGYRIGLTHPGGSTHGIEERVLGMFDQSVQVVVFGHTHWPLVKRVGQVLLVNPGSYGDRRMAPHCSVGLLELGERAEARIINL